MDRIRPALRMPALSLFYALGAVITLAFTLGSPSDPDNSFLFGYSFERIVLGTGLLVLTLALLFLTWYLVRRPEHSLRLWQTLTSRSWTGTTALFLSAFLVLVCWIILFLPNYRLGGMAGYVQRLSPILVWLAVTGAVMTMILFLERKAAANPSADFSSKMILRVGVVTFGLLALIGVVIFISGLGYRYPAEYWYGAGVPVLGLQILFSLLAGGIFLWIEPKVTGIYKVKADVFLFILIWVIAALFWVREPLSPNYFMPDTADNQLYPYSDSSTFDNGAQYALIGQGVFNGNYFGRALYSIFLVYLHTLFGQNFLLLLSVQAALFAVFPALVFLLGKELHSRALGVAVGVLLAFRGVNSITVARWIDTASPKMILTDFPTALGIVILLLLLVKWIKEPARYRLLVWAGAVLGLTLMIRFNVLTLVPVVLVFVPLLMKLNWKQIVMVGLLLLLGMISATLPWEIRNQSRGIPMYSMYYSQILTVLRYRYGIGVDAYLPPSETEFADLQSGTTPQHLTRMRAVRFSDGFQCESTLCSITNHFLHNVATSFVSLPISPVFDDLWNATKITAPFWKKDWSEGPIGAVGLILMTFNAALISLGVGSVWQRSRALALLPILLFAAYLFTNSIGLTSGGRYIAPVDWIVYFYFMAGWLYVVNWLLQTVGVVTLQEAQALTFTNVPSLKRETIRYSLPTLAFVLLLGMGLPLSEMFQQPRYQVREPEVILTELEQAGLLERSGFSHDELMAFLAQPDVMIREGRVLYPRAYRSGEGEQDRSTDYQPRDFRRLVFMLIGPYAPDPEGVVLPGDAPPALHTADVVVIGCKTANYYSYFIDAVIVFVTSGDGQVYSRIPQAPLQCPLPEPEP